MYFFFPAWFTDSSMNVAFFKSRLITFFIIMVSFLWCKMRPQKKYRPSLEIQTHIRKQALATRPNSLHQARIWKYHWTQLDNTTSNQKNTRLWPLAFGPPISDTPMWMVNVLGQGNWGVSILLLPKVTRWAYSNCALVRTTCRYYPFQGSIGSKYRLKKRPMV